MSMDPNSLSALLAQLGGGQQRPLLLNPMLAGAGPAVQPNTPQPILPHAGTPSAPQNQSHNNQAMSLLDQMMRSGGGGAQPQQQQQAPSFGTPGSLKDTMLGRLINTGNSAPDHVGVTPNQITGMGGDMGYLGNLLHGGNLFGNWGSLSSLFGG